MLQGYVYILSVAAVRTVRILPVLCSSLLKQMPNRIHPLYFTYALYGTILCIALWSISQVTHHITHATCNIFFSKEL